jgi:predicted PurR-regulated permease PerM
MLRRLRTPVPGPEAPAPAVASDSSPAVSGAASAVSAVAADVAPVALAGGSSMPQSAPLMTARPTAGDTHWASATKYLMATALVLFGLLVLYWSRGFLPVLITAGLIAFVIRPLIGWFHNRLRFPRSLATGVAYLIAALVILSIPLIIIPTVWSGIDELRRADYGPIFSGIESAIVGAQQTLGGIPVLGDVLSRSLEPINELLRTLQQGALPQLAVPSTLLESLNLSLSSLGALTGVVGPVVAWFVGAALTLLISVYLSSSRYSLRRFVLARLPPAYAPEIAALFARIGWTWGSFLQGQLKLMLFIGVVVFLGNLLLGNRYAAMLGIISGVLELIPSLGPALALIPGLLVALIFGSSWIGVNHFIFAIIVLIFYLLVQIFENQVVVPRVLGDAVELPPLVVLIGVIVAGSQAGILGALIAVPVIGTAREVVGYVYGKIIEAPAPEARLSPEPASVTGLWSAGRTLAARLFGRGGASRS